MSKTYLPYDPDQQLLLPAALQEWLPENHLAYFISDVVDQLDLSEITARYERRAAGRSALQSQDDGEGAAVRLLCRGSRHHDGSPPGCTRISPSGCWRRITRPISAPSRTFGRIIWTALAGLFLQVLMLCQREGLVKLGHVALDGTKVRANASKHKAMSYKRMKEKEAQLQGEVDELLRRAQEVDEEEDRRYGQDKRGDELPAGVGLSGGPAGEDTGGHGSIGSRGPGRC